MEARIKGWKFRGVYDDPRLTEIVKTYEELGFFIKLTPFTPGLVSGCARCIMESPDKYKMLYTKTDSF
ncbi:MAG: hypothetical protein KAH09_11035 [Desulfobacula sp.]|nr:hypothetical protein [Desulfobacula sp.]